MILIGNQYFDISAGLNRIRQLQSQADSELNTKVSKLQAVAQDIYDNSLLAWQEKKAAIDEKKLIINRVQLWSLFLAVAIFLLSLVPSLFLFIVPFILPSYCFSILLFILGFLFLLSSIPVISFFVSGWWGNKYLQTDPCPEKSRIVQYVPSDMVNDWIGAIKRVTISGYTAGTTGEIELLDTLLKSLPNSYFALYGLQIDKSLDVDALVVGPSGVWILESKYWNGVINYYNGKWIRSREYEYRGTVPVVEKEEIPFPPDKEWQKETSIIMNILANTLGLSSEKVKEWIKGGIVFTNDKSSVTIENTCPVRCYTLEDLPRKLVKSETIPEISDETATRIIEALLEYSHGHFPVSDRKSAVDIADGIYIREKSRVDNLRDNYPIINAGSRDQPSLNL